MQDSIPSGCFFIDTSVVLAEILRESTPRLEKFKKDVNFHKVPCYVTDSVRRECDSKIENTLNFLGNIIRESVAVSLETSRQKRKVPMESLMTPEDIVALEELFSSLYSVTKATLPLASPIRIVEEWAVSFLGERLEQGIEISVSQFLIELVKKLLSLTASIQDPYDELVTFEKSFAQRINIVVDSRIIDPLRSLGVHEPDATHIACAICHSMASRQKTVFVTLDYGSILSKKDDIKNALKQICCDPLYAIYYLTR